MSNLLIARRALITGAAALAAAPAWAQTPAPATVPAPQTPPAPPPPPGPPPVRVTLNTSQGAIVIELAVAQAPITTANFLHYVDTKRYDGARFYRALRNPWDATTGLLQGGIQNEAAKVYPPISHEPTSKTGLRHKDGVVSMARWTPGTATGEFFICLGDMGYLDAIPAAPGDNQGFAAFGKVVEGMDVVHRIHALPTSPTLGEGVMKGQMLDPPTTIVGARRAPLTAAA